MINAYQWNYIRNAVKAASEAAGRPVGLLDTLLALRPAQPKPCPPRANSIHF